MRSSTQEEVCAVIAAKDASRTIARAIQSALAERLVAEIVVVDDGSSDDTAEVARDCDDGTGRLKVLELGSNHGPAFARNHAIAHSSSPLIAILDADDFFLEGRFERLLDGDDWDFAADNILFVENPEQTGREPRFAPDPRWLDLRSFVEGNISRRGVQRRETGFLKPVMRRDFLKTNGLRYDERLRLGEDYSLYVSALARGARYKVVHTCGYGAVVRADSLSGRHTTEDLRRLWRADETLLGEKSLPEQSRRVIRRHARQLRDRYELRQFLDTKRKSGFGRALLDASRRPLSLPAIAAGIASDKLGAASGARSSPADETPSFRCLLPGRLLDETDGTPARPESGAARFATEQAS